MLTITQSQNKMQDTEFSRRTSNRRSTEMLSLQTLPAPTQVSYSLVNNNADWENLRLKLLELSEASIPFSLEKEDGFKRIRLTY
jgi:hypothetical protein